MKTSEFKRAKELEKALDRLRELRSIITYDYAALYTRSKFRKIIDIGFLKNDYRKQESITFEWINAEFRDKIRDAIVKITDEEIERLTNEFENL